jgi:phosphatidylinositol alpha-mannosyltransferase
MKDCIKVAFFGSALPFVNGKRVGGVDIANLTLASSLQNIGYNVTFYYIFGGSEVFTFKTKKIFYRLSKILPDKFFRLLILPVSLNFLNFKNYDVIILTGDDWFFFRRQIKSIRIFQGSAFYESRYATSFKRKISQKVITYFEKLSSRLADCVLCSGINSSKIYKADAVVDNIVIEEDFKPSSIKAQNPTVLFVGTWHGRKRGKFLFERFTEEVLLEIPDARLIMVSDFCPKHPNVEFFLNVDKEKLLKFFSESWVFAYPSLYEGFGRPYLEAMNCGLPVLATENLDNEGLIRVVGDAGVLVKDSEFKEALVKFLTDADLRKKYEEKGLIQAKKFSKNKVLDTYSYWIDKVVEKSRLT